MEPFGKLWSLRDYINGFVKVLNCHNIGIITCADCCGVMFVLKWLWNLFITSLSRQWAPYWDTHRPEKHDINGTRPISSEAASHIDDDVKLLVYILWHYGIPTTSSITFQDIVPTLVTLLEILITKGSRIIKTNNSIESLAQNKINQDHNIVTLNQTYIIIQHRFKGCSTNERRNFNASSKTYWIFKLELTRDVLSIEP